MIRNPLSPAVPPRCATTAVPITLALALALTAVANPAGANTFGSLSNFDAVNDTGKESYGFEIEFEDHGFYKVEVSSIFGLNRSFGNVAGGDPLAVVRFGAVRVEDYDVAGVHAGVRITYGGVAGSAIATPTGSFANPGDSCWPGSNAWNLSAACDHYGVSTLGSPAKTTYYWLLKDAGGNLVKQAAALPGVQFAYTPPAAGAPAMVNVQIRAVAEPAEQPNDNRRWGEPLWVKTFTTKLPRNIDLGNLLRGDAAMEAAEVETEWSTFQKAPLVRNAMGANEIKEMELNLDPQDKTVMRRYEFYKYLGPLDVDGLGEVDCNDFCETDPYGLNAQGDHFGTSFVGAYVGQQMAGFNLAAVPEPQSWALLLAGLGFLGWRGSRAGRRGAAA